jgi:signal transduction histidine kinase
VKTFRSRLILALSVSVGALVLATSTGLVLASQAWTRQSLDDDLTRRARAGGPEFRPLGGPPGDRPGRRGARLMANETRRPRVFDASGDAIGPEPDQAPWDEAALQRSLRGESLLITITEEGRRLRVVSLPIPPRQGQPGGAVQAAQELDDLERFFAGQWIVVAIAAPLGILLSILLGRVLAGRFLRPLDSMTSRAHQLAESGEPGSLPVAGDDEMARLAGAVNSLLNRLAESLGEEREARNEAERLLESQRRFTADASHELRTPLTRLRLIADGAAHPDSEPDEMRKALERVSESTEEMSRLVEQLLALARAEAGADALREESFDFHHLAEVAAGGAGLEVGQRLLIYGHGRIVGDFAMLRRAVINLLVNAARACPEPGRLTLFLRGSELGVEDEGAGFPESHLERVGERFHRVDEARSRREGGHGLGLAIVRSIAELHGGSLKAENQPEGGARVSIVLPESRLLNKRPSD